MQGGSRTPQQTAPLLQQKETHEAKIARIRKEMDGRQKRIDNIEERINTIEDAIYAELNEKVSCLLQRISCTGRGACTAGSCTITGRHMQNVTCPNIWSLCEVQLTKIPAL